MTNKYKVPPQIKVRVKSANEIGNGKKAFLSRRTAGDVIFDTDRLYHHNAVSSS